MAPLTSAAPANSGTGASEIAAPAADSRLSARVNAVDTATDRSSRTSVFGTASRSPRNDTVGKSVVDDDNTRSRVTQSFTVRAIGPAESSVNDNGNTPSSGTRRAVGLKATSPLSAAGMRTDPPVSVPMAAAAMPSVTEMAAPDEDPPGMRAAARSYTLRGVP